MKINKAYFPYMIIVAFILFFIIGMMLGFVPIHEAVNAYGKP